MTKPLAADSQDVSYDAFVRSKNFQYLGSAAIGALPSGITGVTIKNAMNVGFGYDSRYNADDVVRLYEFRTSKGITHNVLAAPVLHKEVVAIALAEHGREASQSQSSVDYQLGKFEPAVWVPMTPDVQVHKITSLANLKNMIERYTHRP